MNYESFLLAVKEDLGTRLGSDYQITLRAIPKNNGVFRDGVSICRKGEEIAPTIYLNEFYSRLEEGQTLAEIQDSIYYLYLSNPSLPYLDSRALSSYQMVKDRIVYKLVNIQANLSLLKRLPHIPFHDMAMVCYLLIEQKDHGYMTALVHKEHLKTWHIREKELFTTAIHNTPRLLPSTIQPMSEMLKHLAQDTLGESCQDESLDALIEAAEERRMQQNPMFPDLYVLTNTAGVNGAACMAYPYTIKNFADRLEQDLLILPSSIHEVLLVTDSGNYDYNELSCLVRDINNSEVPAEDQLSNQIYRYNREDDTITIVSHGPVLSGTGNR